MTDTQEWGRIKDEARRILNIIRPTDDESQARIIAIWASTRITELEAQLAKKKKALEQISEDCQSTVDRFDRIGPSFTSPVGDEYEPASHIINKLTELGDIARRALGGKND